MTLANHAAVVIARDALAAQAAQATALREADVLKDSLLSLVSHELRTPLAAIKASATGLLQPGSVWDQNDRQGALQAINSEADRLAALVSNLLDLSRLEAGAWQPAKDWCDLAEIVGTVLDHLPEADAGRVQVCLSESLPFVRADYIQIALVLTNLLENAIKYTPPHSPICVSATSTDQSVTMTVPRLRRRPLAWRRRASLRAVLSWSAAPGQHRPRHRPRPGLVSSYHPRPRRTPLGCQCACQ